MVTGWIGADKLGDPFRSGYIVVAAAGKKSGTVAASLVSPLKSPGEVIGRGTI